MEHPVYTPKGLPPIRVEKQTNKSRFDRCSQRADCHLAQGWSYSLRRNLSLEFSSSSRLEKDWQMEMGC